MKIKIPQEKIDSGDLTVLSFHPCICGDINIICAGRDPSKKEIEIIKKVDAVVLPHIGRESIYKASIENCPNVFPNYDSLFNYPEKVNQTKLFNKLGIDHPETYTFENYQFFLDSSNQTPFKMPFVFKHSWGGAGRNVFLIQSQAEFEKALMQVQEYEKEAKFGFLLQKFVPCKGISLRVVLINNDIIPYWRIAKHRGFYSNVSRGADINRTYAPELVEKAKKAMLDFCKETKINLAGFDFIFSEKQKNPKPIFLEINYFFAYKGIGGARQYYKKLAEAINNWLDSLIS